jgi:hypothetical protein
MHESLFPRECGLRPWLDDPTQRAQQMAFTLITARLATPATPFGRVSRQGLLLTPRTHDLLYDSAYGRLHEPYRRGTRPLLEAWVARCTQAGMSPAQKAIALSQSLLHELPRVYPKSPVFLYGEDDEDTLLKGGGHCSCKARLLTALCQVAGIDARPVLMWPWRDPANPDALLAGHSVVEACIDGQWGFLDPQAHAYAMTRDGRLPSVAQIRQDPSLFTDMPREIQERMQPEPYKDVPHRSFFEHYAYKNFNPRCPTSISRHDVNHPGTPRWNWADAEFRRKQAHDFEHAWRLLRELAEQGQLDDQAYRMNSRQLQDRFGLVLQLPELADDERPD